MNYDSVFFLECKYHCNTAFTAIYGVKFIGCFWLLGPLTWHYVVATVRKQDFIGLLIIIKPSSNSSSKVNPIYPVFDIWFPSRTLKRIKDLKLRTTSAYKLLPINLVWTFIVLTISIICLILEHEAGFRLNLDGCFRLFTNKIRIFPVFGVKAKAIKWRVMK